MKIFPVILSGGSGTRLWPSSREDFPKQYLTFFNEHSLLQNTILRLAKIDTIDSPIIVCNEEHRFIVAHQLEQIEADIDQIILEPCKRNTAPAIAAAAAFVEQEKNCKDYLLFVLPADQIITDEIAFKSSLEKALKAAKNDKFIIFGVKPHCANTGFGYIKTYRLNKNTEVADVEKFVEKPDKTLAEKYLAHNLGLYEQGDPPCWFWNSGMFILPKDLLAAELLKYGDNIWEAAKNSVKLGSRDLDFFRLNSKYFRLSPDISIDYALMEKSKAVMVVSLEAGWSDLGSWPALHDLKQTDEDGNFFDGDVIGTNTENCFVKSSNMLISTLGVKDLIIVQSPDAILVTNHDNGQKISLLINELRQADRKEVLNNKKVYRPWGWFDSIELGVNFQVKRLHVNPSGKLSLQMHHKRAEHWVVVNGIATVVLEERTLSLSEGESIYIPLGAKHSLENNTNYALDIIEVQTGTYFGEDDIVRFSDVYGRID